MSQHLNTYGRWYLTASYGGQPVEITGDRYPDRMSWVESRAAEVLAEIATSTAAKNGERQLETATTYQGRHVLAADKDRTAASAPATVVHSGKRAALRPYNVPRDWVSPKDLLSRCTAASRLTLTGRQWTADDVAECTSAIVLATLASEVGKDRSAGYVAPKAAEMSRLTHLAANWRRGEDRQRTRDATDVAGRASITGKVYATVSDGVTAGPMAAARTAIDALQNLGLDATSARRVWPLAYTAARSTDIDSERIGEAIAAELNMSHAAYRQAISRARSYVPSAKPWTNSYTGTEHDHVYGYVEHLAAVCAECEAIAPDPRALATDAADGPDWPARSAKRYKGAPVTVRRDASVKRDQRRNYPPADWTLALAPNTRRRLKTASDMKRARAAARTAAETETRQLAAGIAG